MVRCYQGVPSALHGICSKKPSQVSEAMVNEHPNSIWAGAKAEFWLWFGTNQFEKDYKPRRHRSLALFSPKPLRMNQATVEGSGPRCTRLSRALQLPYLLSTWEQLLPDGKAGERTRQVTYTEVLTMEFSCLTALHVTDSHQGCYNSRFEPKEWGLFERGTSWRSQDCSMHF